MFDFGIAGFRPEWHTGRTAVAGAHGRRLAALEGRRLTRPLLAWDPEDDTWFADGLVLLDFDDEQVEIVHQKFDELSITWNAVDPTLDLVYSGIRLVWRDDVPGELAALHGQRLRAVELLEWAGEDLAHGMVAVSFVFPDDRVTIYNALDENGLDFGTPDHRYTHHRLGPS